MGPLSVRGLCLRVAMRPRLQAHLGATELAGVGTCACACRFVPIRLARVGQVLVCYTHTR